MENSKEYYTNELQNYLREWKLDAIGKEKVNLKQDIRKVNILKRLCSKGADLDYLEEERRFFCIPNVFWSQRLIKFFIERGRDVNSQDQNGNTALHLALRYGRLGKIKDAFPVSQMNLIKFVLDQNANPNVVNLKGNTALFTLAACYIVDELESIEDSILEVSEMLLQKGAKIEIRNNNGISLLHLYQIYYSTRMIDWFIQKFDGDIDIRTSECFYSQTPLMIAANYFHSSGRSSLDCCQVLIRRGADVNAKDLQGYTALHHALMAHNSDDNKCLEFLVDSGADLNAKTGSGKDAYEFAIHCYREFTYGAAPIKQAEILEMLSAMYIMGLRIVGLRFGLLHLDKAMNVYKTYDLKPSDEFLANYAFVKENKNNQKELHGAAIKTIARLSSCDISRFWNLLAFTPSSTYMESDISPYVFETLNFLSLELKRVKDFASSEQTDLGALQSLAHFFEKWFITLIENGQKSKAREGILHFHSIVSLAIACLEKLIRLNKNMTVSCSRDLYYNFTKALVIIRTSLGDIIPEATVKHNERLLRYLIKLDLVYNNGETSSDLYKIFETDIELMDIVLDSGILGYKEKNKMVLRPFQLGNGYSEFPLTERRLKYVLRIVEGGAHVDARNGEDEPTIKEILEKNERNSSFPYDTLQCMCARVLVRSLVPFKNRVPKRIVNFILQH